MIRTLIFCAALGLTACTTTPPATAANPQPAPEIAVGKTAAAGLAASFAVVMYILSLGG